MTVHTAICIIYLFLGWLVGYVLLKNVLALELKRLM